LGSPDNWDTLLTIAASWTATILTARLSLKLSVDCAISVQQDEATQEHEVAEALFDLANMFAAAEPVLEAEEAATNSPPAGRAAAGGGHRAKRARNAKTRAAAEPVFPSRTSARNHAAHHSAHTTASGFQVLLLLLLPLLLGAAALL
jgi:hypothetical protein